MPDAAEIDPLVLELRHLDDLGKALDAAHEGIFHGAAEGARESEEGRGREAVLSADENDEMVEEGLPDRGRGPAIAAAREIDAADFGSEGAGNALDCDPLSHGWHASSGHSASAGRGEANAQRRSSAGLEHRCEVSLP